MQKRKRLLAIVIIAVLMASGITVNATTHTLNMVERRQEYSNWCWAATTLMIIDYLGTWSPLPSQTDIVTTVKGSAVNEGATYQDMTNALSWYMVANTPRSGILSFAEVKEMLSGWYSPIETSIGWVGGGGHAQIIYGYEENGIDQGLYVIDPRASGAQRCYYGFNDYQVNDEFYWRYTWYQNRHNT